MQYTVFDGSGVLTFCFQFSQVTSNIIEAIVSVRRLSEFLRAEELQASAVQRIEKPSLSVGDEVLSIRDGEFQWTKNGIQPSLEGINLTVRKGELVGILGRVGDGKVCLVLAPEEHKYSWGDVQSSLLSAIIGDMRKVEGEVILSGNVAYAAQNPWYVRIPGCWGWAYGLVPGFCLPLSVTTFFSRTHTTSRFIILSSKVHTFDIQRRWFVAHHCVHSLCVEA